jgi:hypothetical protein
MLRWQFTIASTAVSEKWQNTAVLKIWELFLDANVKKIYEIWEVVEWVIFENIIKYDKNWKDAFFLSRSFIPSDEADKKKVK